MTNSRVATYGSDREMMPPTTPPRPPPDEADDCGGLWDGAGGDGAGAAEEGED